MVVFLSCSFSGSEQAATAATHNAARNAFRMRIGRFCGRDVAWVKLFVAGGIRIQSLSVDREYCRTPLDLFPKSPSRFGTQVRERGHRAPAFAPTRYGAAGPAPVTS